MKKISKHEFMKWLDNILTYDNFTETCKAAKFRIIDKATFEEMKTETLQFLKSDPAYQDEEKSLKTLELFLNDTGHNEYANYKFILGNRELSFSEDELYYIKNSKLLTDYVVVDSKRTVTKEGWVRDNANFEFDTVLYEIKLDEKSKYPHILEVDHSKKIIEIKRGE